MWTFACGMLAVNFTRYIILYCDVFDSVSRVSVGAREIFIVCRTILCIDSASSYASDEEQQKFVSVSTSGECELLRFMTSTLPY